MEFQYDENIDAWKVYLPILGVDSNIILDGLDIRPGLTKEKAVEEVLNRINANILKIESLIQPFCEVYNSDCANPEDGIPLLSEKEFMDKIVLNGVNYEIEDSENDSLFLYFSESGLLGGHLIEIFWESNGEMSAELVG